MTKQFDRRSNAELLAAARAELDKQIALRRKACKPEHDPVSIYDATVRYYERLVEEEQQLLALQVPASFTRRKPDTPLAQAARDQLEIIRGKKVPKTSGGGVTRGSRQRRTRQPGPGPGNGD